VTDVIAAAAAAAERGEERETGFVAESASVLVLRHTHVRRGRDG